MVEPGRLTFCYKFHSEQINIKKSYCVSIELNFHEFMYTQKKATSCIRGFCEGHLLDHIQQFLRKKSGGIQRSR